MKLKFKFKSLELVQWIMIVGIFFERYFELIILLLSMFFIFKSKKHIKLSPIVSSVIAVISLHAFVMNYILDYELSKTIQQFIVITLFIIGYHYIFHNYIQYIKKELLLQKYLKVLYFTCCIGLIQFSIYFLTNIDVISFLLSKEPQIITDRIIRVNSFMLEPSYLGTMIIPFYVCLFFFPYILSKTFNTKQKILIIIVSVLTFSTILFIIILLMLYFRIMPKLASKLKILILITTIILSVNTIQLLGSEFPNSKGINGVINKISETSYVLTDINDPKIFDTLNLTSYATLSNLWVALNSPFRWLGTGIGTHEQNYYNVYYTDSVKYGTNASDGYSLFTRLLSEFGYIGILIYFIGLIKCLNKKDSANYCSFWILISLLCRGGNYILYGCMFFHFLFIYSSKNKDISCLNNKICY